MGINFDPNIPGMIQGEMTKVRVIDPARPLVEGQANLVVRTGERFEIECEWQVSGTQRQIYLNNGQANWQIEAFAESMGPGPDFKLGPTSTLSKGVPGDWGTDPVLFKTIHPVDTNPLLESNPADNHSGVYKIVVTCFLNSSIPGGFDLAGFYEGPMIHVESLE